MKQRRQTPTGLATISICACALLVCPTGTGFAENAALHPQGANASSQGGSSCFVHLWDGKNFTDRDIRIEGPGRFSNLRDLPGSNGKSWDDEADSLKVGPAATVKTWKKMDFKGASQTYEPGSEHSKLSEEPSSLEITCK